MLLIEKTRKGASYFVQMIGMILWAICGLAVLVWALSTLSSTFGIWAVVAGLLFAPVTYVASIFIVWFSTNNFPVLILTPYIVSWLGLGILYAGSRIRRKD